MGLALCRLDGSLVDVNPAYAGLLGRTVQETLLLTYWEITPSEYAEQEQEQLEELQRLGRYGPYEKEYLRKDGSRLPVQLSGCLLDLEGETYIWSSAEDISARKHAERTLVASEHRFRETLETVALLAVTLDSSGTITFCNDYLLKLTGWQQAEALGRSWFETFLPLETRREVARVFAQSLETGIIPSHYENEVLTRSGPRRLIRWSNTLLRDGEGTILGTVSLGEDITELRRNEKLLLGQKQVLEMTAAGKPLYPTLTALLQVIESQSPGLQGSILLMDADGLRVRHGAAPSLPVEYTAALDGQPIGPCAGSCGTAAYRRAPVYVEDIATDPLWAAYKAVALPHGLRACWSTPIFDSRRRVLGLFAMYYQEPKLPQAEHLQLIEIATHTAAIAIIAHLAEEELRNSEQRLQLFIDHAPAALAMFDQDMRYLAVSRRWRQDYGLGERTLLGISHYEVFPEVPEPWKMVHQRGLAGEIVRADEDRFERADGAVQWLRWEVRPWLNAAGNVGGIVMYTEDISARKLGEMALRESDAKYRTLFEHAPEGILIADPESHYLDANAGICKLLGYTREELITLDATAIVAPEEFPHIESALETLESAAEHHREWRFRRKDGSTFEAEVDVTTMPDGTYLALVRDITERKQAEAALRASMEQLRFVADHAPVLLAQCSHDRRYKFVNQGYAELFGLKPAEILGRHPRELLGEAAYAVASPHMDLALSGQSTGYDFSLPATPAGARRLAVSYAPERDATGAVLGFIAAISDITQRKQAEEDLAQRATELAAINSLSSGLSHAPLDLKLRARLALDGLTRAISPDLALLFLREGEELVLLQSSTVGEGTRPREEVVHQVGTHLCDLAAKEGRAIFSRDIHRDPGSTWDGCKAAGLQSFAALPLKSGDEDIGVLVLASAAERDFELRSAFLETLAAQVAARLQNALLHERLRAYATSLEHRVAERTALLREANEDLALAVEHAQSADRAKSAFLSAMSHELRTPLNSVIGFTGVLLQGLVGELEPRQQEPLRIVQRNGRHLLALINDVLDLSKIEARELRLSHLPFDLTKVIQETLESMAPTAAAKGLRLTQALQVEALPCVGDSRRVTQILLNLLSNALKFTEQGTVDLSLTHGGGLARIAVQDTGPGIAERDLPRLFQEFEQLDTGLARRSDGTGLGLALSRRLARLMGGDILVESTLTQGSTFTLLLPLNQGEKIP